MAAKQDKYPRKGRNLGSSGPVTLTAECAWEVPAGSSMKPADHGTTTRYGQAVRVGATPCQRCRTANTQADLAYRAKRKAAAPKADPKAKKEGAKVIDHLAAQKAKAGTPGARTAGDQAVRGTKVG